MKEARINLRSSVEEKNEFEKAAAVLQMDLSDFLRLAARAFAKKTLEEHEKITVSNEDRDVILKALSDPPAPNQALRSAMKRYRSNVKQ